MPRAVQFTDRMIAKEAKPGTPLFIRDTPGLYLLTSTHPRKGHFPKQRWIVRYTNPDTGRVTTKSIGPYPAMSLEMARNSASYARKAVRVDKRNPFDKDEDLTNEGRKTYGEFAQEWLKLQNFKTDKQRRNYELLLLVYPETLLDKPLLRIRPQTICDALMPRWESSPLQVRYSLALMAKLFSRAKGQGLYLRGVDNPAQWKGVQEHHFPPMPEVEENHRPAMPYKDVRGFFKELRQRNEPAATMLQFCILTAVRSNEVRGMRWKEVEGNLWTVPKARMKKKNNDHTVPLSPQALALIDKPEHISGYVFPGEYGKPMGPKAMPRILRRMGSSKEQASVHGFRSSFRDWAEVNGFDFVAAEKCLAHVVGTKVTRSYLRDDLLDKRCEIMNAWGSFLAG